MNLRDDSFSRSPYGAAALEVCPRHIIGAAAQQSQLQTPDLCMVHLSLHSPLRQCERAAAVRGAVTTMPSLQSRVVLEDSYHTAQA